MNFYLNYKSNLIKTVVYFLAQTILYFIANVKVPHQRCHAEAAFSLNRNGKLHI